jgi:hypothetical protein
MPTTRLTNIETDDFTIYKLSSVEQREIDLHKRTEAPSIYWAKYPFDRSGSSAKWEKAIVVPKKAAKTRSEVEGAILYIEEFSVVCEVYLDKSQNRTMPIRLPKILFPENIHHGTPITIAYRQDKNGFRRPSVTLRKIYMTDVICQDNDEMDELVNQF